MRAPDTLPPEVQRDLDAMDAAVAGRRPDGGDAVLAELAAMLAETRPAPDPGWTRELDVRAAEGFAKPKRAVRPGAARRSRLQFVLAPAAGLAACAVIAVAVGLAGSGTSGNAPTMGGSSSAGSSSSADSAGSAGSSTSASGPATEQSRSAPTAPPPAGASAGAGSAPAIAPLPGPVPSPGDPRSDNRSARKVERSASMTLGARRRDIDAVADGASRVASGLGGFVASSTISSRQGGTLDLRVPSNRLDEAITRLSRLAHVRRLERSTLDITALSVSAKTRVADLTAERNGLRRQLAHAVTLDETARLKAKLASVNRRLQAARAASRRVQNRASYANLTVELVAEHNSAAATGGGFSPGTAWHDALRVLEVAAGIALIAFAVALPLALIGAPAWFARQRITRRRRERALDLA